MLGFIFSTISVRTCDDLLFSFIHKDRNVWLWQAILTKKNGNRTTSWGIFAGKEGYIKIDWRESGQVGSMIEFRRSWICTCLVVSLASETRSTLFITSFFNNFPQTLFINPKLLDVLFHDPIPFEYWTGASSLFHWLLQTNAPPFKSVKRPFSELNTVWCKETTFALQKHYPIS